MNMADNNVRIVILGSSVSENSHVGNFILGRAAFDSEAPPDVVERVGGRLKDRHVIIINSPQLLQTNISDHQITQTVRECVHLSDPGPHVFILILQHEDFTEDDLRRVKHVLKEFSEDAIKHTIVITTDEQMHRAKVNESIKQLTAECGGGHLQVKDKNKICSQIFKTVKNTRKRKYSETIKETPKIGLSLDAEASGSVDSDLSDIHKVKKEEWSTYSLPQTPNPFSRIVESPDVIRPNMSVLNLVVCGRDETLKSSISELILQQKDRRSDEDLHGRQINLVELPALSHLSEEEVMCQTLRCVFLCHPGVHAFLLVIPVGPLNNEDKAEIEKIQKIFDSREHFVLLFTTSLSVEGLATDLVKSNTKSCRLISHRGGQYRVIELKQPGNSRQIPELLDYLEKMKPEPYSTQMYVKAQENRVRHELEEQHQKELKKMEEQIKELKQRFQSEVSEDKQDDLGCLRIVLIGRTGNGKSATGNTILGRNVFVSQLRPDSVTTLCMKGVGEVKGRSVAVVDTPGLFDTTLTNDQTVEEIVKCISLSSPGPHVFVIVLSLGRFTNEENETMQLIKKIFGPKAAQFSIVLFTRGDDLQESIEDYVSKYNCAELKKLIRDCGDRFLVFNNREQQDKTQVIQLFNMIEKMNTHNTDQYFTNSMYQEAEMSIKKKMEEILRKKEREIQAQNEKLRVKYETEMEELKKKLEEEKRKADEERKQRENEFREKEKKLKKEFEKKEKTEQKKQETENQKRSEEEKQKKAEYNREMEKMKREIENQRLQFEKQQKEKEQEDRKREEKYRQDQEKMKQKQELIAELQMKQEEETKKRESEERKRIEQEENQREEWKRKVKDAEHDRKEIQEEIKRQQREWEDEKKQKMKEREEEERKIKEKHEKQLRVQQKELEKIRNRFEREREKDRQKIEKERQKQKREREDKEREYEEKKQEMERYYEQLEQERKEEWDRRKREDDEKQEEERKRWEKMIEDLKQEQEKEKKRREKEENEGKEREEKERDEMKKKYEGKIRAMKKKHEDEARKQAEELNDLRDKESELEKLKKDIEDFKNRRCSMM